MVVQPEAIGPDTPGAPTPGRAHALTGNMLIRETVALVGEVIPPIDAQVAAPRGSMDSSIAAKILAPSLRRSAPQSPRFSRL